MSKEHADTFVEKAKTDPSIQKALHERTKHPVDIGREHGLHFTKEELSQSMLERNIPESDFSPWCSTA
jgi:predicted ribosomally synthesized peptide with nif11-like leader